MPEARMHYQDQLDTLEKNCLGGLDLVIASLDRTMEAVQHQDMELAELVIADDDRIDGRYLEVHQGILTMLATQAPVATDLRLISALLHVMHSIERMGDQCVNISKVIPLTGNDAPVHDEMVDRIVLMGKQGRSMLSQAKKAFEGRDVELARDLVRQDDLIDNLNKECFKIAVQVGDDADIREWAMTMMLVARALERIGDNAVDIGEQVAFVVTGLFREFEDASHPGQAPLLSGLGYAARSSSAGSRAPAQAEGRPRGRQLGRGHPAHGSSPPRPAHARVEDDREHRGGAHHHAGRGRGGEVGGRRARRRSRSGRSRLRSAGGRWLPSRRGRARRPPGGGQAEAGEDDPGPQKRHAGEGADDEGEPVAKVGGEARTPRPAASRCRRSGDERAGARPARSRRRAASPRASRPGSCHGGRMREPRAGPRCTPRR